MKKTILIEFIVLLVLLNSVLAGPAQEIRNGLLELENVKLEMQSAGIGTIRIQDMIQTGFVYLSNNKFEEANQTIESIYELRDDAFRAQKDILLVKQVYHDVKEQNLTLVNTTENKVEWSIDHAEREFERENFEGAILVAQDIKAKLVISTVQRYSYLEALLDEIELSLEELGLSNSRIITLRILLHEGIETGMLEELMSVEREIRILESNIGRYRELLKRIPDLKQRNISISRTEDSLDDIKISFNLAEHVEAKKKLFELEDLINNTLTLDQKIKDFKIVLQETDELPDYAKIEENLQRSEQALRLGNYEEAEQEYIATEQKFESAKAEFLVKEVEAKKPSFRKWLKKNWNYVVAVAVVMAVVLLLTSQVWLLALRKQRLKQLHKELAVTEEMLKDLQRNYFIKRKLSRENYDETYESLNEKMIKMNEKISSLSKKIKKGKE